jgi:hypothetical protein
MDEDNARSSESRPGLATEAKVMNEHSQGASVGAGDASGPPALRKPSGRLCDVPERHPSVLRVMPSKSTWVGRTWYRKATVTFQQGMLIVVRGPWFFPKKVGRGVIGIRTEISFFSIRCCIYF